MQMIDLTLSHATLFSPANGELISHELIGIDEDAKSLVAYWINGLFWEPFIKDVDLAIFWQLMLDEKEDELEYYTQYYEALETFLEEYEKATWIVFKITNGEKTNDPGDKTTWFVIDMEAVN